jgi:hypothetical protein
MERRIDPQELAEYLDSLPDLMRRRIVEAEEKSAAEAQQALADASSGALTRRDLMRMGHPFAVRAPQPELADPAVINHQPGGTFQDNWQIQPTEETGEGVFVSVVNSDPAARWMGGTARMVERPIIEAVREKQEPARRQRLDEAAREVMKGPGQ